MCAKHKVFQKMGSRLMLDTKTEGKHLYLSVNKTNLKIQISRF